MNGFKKFHFGSYIEKVPADARAAGAPELAKAVLDRACRGVYDRKLIDRYWPMRTLV